MRHDTFTLRNELRLFTHVKIYFVKYDSNVCTVHSNSIFFWSGFTPCKTEQILQAMESQEKEKSKDENYMRKLFRKNPKIKGV